MVMIWIPGVFVCYPSHEIWNPWPIKRHVCSLFRSWSKYWTDFVCFVIFNLLTVWFALKNSRRHSCIYNVYYYWHDSGSLKFTMDDRITNDIQLFCRTWPNDWDSNLNHLRRLIQTCLSPPKSHLTIKPTKNTLTTGQYFWRMLRTV